MTLKALLWIWMLVMIGWYILPGVVAIRHWMCVRRDVYHNAAKLAKRERR